MLKRKCRNIVQAIYGLLLRNKYSSSKTISNKRILLLAEFGLYGGTRTYVNSLISLLTTNEYVIYFVQNQNNIQNNSEEIATGKNVISLICDYNFSNNRNIYHSLKLLRKVISKFDITLTLASEGSVGEYIPIFFLPTRNLLIEHTCPTTKLHERYASLLKKNKKQSQIVCVSEYQKNQLRQNWPNNSLININTIYNSSSFQSFTYPPKSVTEKIFITIAQVVEYKNPSLWYEVAKTTVARYESAHFIWIGDGPLYSDYQNKAKDEQRIKFMGYQDHDKIQKVLSQSFIYLGLSTFESLGISVIDAMAYGIPSIVMKTGGLPELIKNRENGYVIENLDDCISSIDELMKYSDLYDAMKNESLLKYENTFSFKKWQKSYLDLLELI